MAAGVRVLSPDVINKIAAGEVVERPASAVKELVENSIDAGATRIEVILEGGGKDRIEVIDDGSGMSREDALLAVERHATSKLRDADGLFHIASYGFRGEAVPAIASVSRMTLLTRTADDIEGSRIEIHGGEVVAVEPSGAPKGTRITVEDLFYAVPARRKYLKRQETEAGHVSEAMIRLALSKPSVGFTLRSGGRVSFQSPGSGDPKERIAAAVGKGIHEHLLPVDWDRGGIAVRGHVASPDWSTSGTRAIYTFVNGRFVRDRQLLHAIQRAFADVLPPGRMPGAFLFFDLPPEEVDVNVHPQKLEVRFVEPRAAYEAALRSVQEALRTTPWLQFGAGRGGGAAEVRKVPASPQPGFDWSRQAAGPAVREAAAGLWPRPGDAELAGGPSGWVPPPSDPDVAGAQAPGMVGTEERGAEDRGDGEAPGFFSALRYIGQFAGTYLVCEGPGGNLVLLDQHAAHERLTFHRLREAWRRRDPVGQPFLFPLVLDMGVADARILVEHLDALREVGFELEPFGGTSFSLQSIPAELTGVDYQRILSDMARELATVGAGRALDDAMTDILATMACHASVRAHQALLPEEAERLLQDLDTIDFKAACPHGRPVAARFSVAELEKRVGRR
jgi:DNA mismatch repair protein MutL